jgi:hypothetical protein
VYESRAEKAADERVGGTGRQAEVPRDDVPCDGSDESAENHVDEGRFARSDLDDAAHRVGHLGLMEEEHRREVEERRPQYRQTRRKNARRDDGGDGIGRVVKAVDGVEDQRDRDDADDKNPGACIHDLRTPRSRFPE